MIRRTGEVVLKIFKIMTITAIGLLLPIFAYSATYEPLPEVVPAYDLAAEPKQVIKPAVRKKASKKRKVRRQKRKGYTYQKVVKPFNQEIRLFAGETRVMKEPNAGRLAVGNGGVLSAAVLDEKEILLIANDVGISSLHIWTKNGKNRRIKVTVVPNDTPKISREIASFLRKIPNAKASLIGEKVVVEGDNMTDADLMKIEELAKRYPQIINFTNKVGWEKMIAMDVRVVEFPSSYLREVGVQWGARGGASVGGLINLGKRQHSEDGDYTIANPLGSPISSAGVTNAPSSLHLLSVLNVGFDAQLNLMEENGSATVLARPKLSTRSGSKAKFLAGGEVPYSVTSFAGTTILFKEYGISLEIEPTVDRNGVIRAKVMSEVSEIDPALSVPGGPALLTRMTESEFNVKNGETIVLSGLLQKSKSTSIEKLPFLGDIPVLGALFKSKRFQDDQTELVVFVTPTATDKHTDLQDAEMRDADKRVSEVVNGEEKPKVQEVSPATYPEVVVPDAPPNSNGPVGPQAVLSPNKTYVAE